MNDTAARHVCTLWPTHPFAGREVLPVASGCQVRLLMGARYPVVTYDRLLRALRDLGGNANAAKSNQGVRRSSSSPRVCSTCAPLGSNWNDRHKHVQLTEERWRVWEALQHTSHLSHSPSNHQQMQGVRARNTKAVDQLHGTTYIKRLLLGNNKGKMHAGTVRGVEGS